MTTKNTFRAILADWLQQCGSGQEWIITHTTGWHNGAYIMPDGEVIGDPETPIPLMVAALHLPVMPFLVRLRAGGIQWLIWPVATHQ